MSAAGVSALGLPVPVPRTFFDRPTLDVARELLGTYLVRQLGDDTLVGRIVETEAYVGPDDRASHASHGRTRRTEIMFGEPGPAYVYLIHGMYEMLNVVTESASFPAAVLIRALEPVGGITARTDGPGRLCRALAIDRALNGHPLDRPPLWIAHGPVPAEGIWAGPRVGVGYAGEWAARPWRFCLRPSRWVSAPRPT